MAVSFFSCILLIENTLVMAPWGQAAAQSPQRMHSAWLGVLNTSTSVSYTHLDPEGDFYKDFVADISTYPTTYIVDGEGNIVGADIVGNVKKQLDTVETRLALITGQK